MVTQIDDRVGCNEGLNGCEINGTMSGRVSCLLRSIGCWLEPNEENALIVIDEGLIMLYAMYCIDGPVIPKPKYVPTYLINGRYKKSFM